MMRSRLSSWEKFSGTALSWQLRRRLMLAIRLRSWGRIANRVIGELRVQANIENIADVNYIASADNNNNITPGAGRIYRLTVVANF
ncbi:MAG: hypothetical protein ABJA60_05645 [Nitrosospira sp.]